MQRARSAQGALARTAFKSSGQQCERLPMALAMHDPGCGSRTRWAKISPCSEWFVARINATFHSLLPGYLEIGGG